jgi:ribosomal protein S18 acetylase RimI-like enzyme
MEIRIEGYREEWKHHFEKLNRVWIEKYFEVEPIDEYTFRNIDELILKAGGQLLFATLDSKVIGTVAIKPISKDTIELSKMAVDENYFGLGAGKLLCKKAVEKMKKLGYAKAHLYTHSSFKNAIHIYKNEGFYEIEIEPGKYKRADIKMEKIL